MRCARCGNENADTNRFCGMCGTPLAATAQTGTGSVSPPATADPSATPVVPSARSSVSPIPSTSVQSAVPPQAVPAGGAYTERRAPEPSAFDNTPVITGPSFLGLNKPAAGSGERGSPKSGHDHLRRSAHNLDYLLEDDEEPKRGGGKLILILLALALALGFGYLRWRRGGFDSLISGTGNVSAQASPQTPSQIVPQSAGTSPAEPNAGAESPASTPTAPAAATASSSPANGSAAPAGTVQSSPSPEASSGGATPETGTAGAEPSSASTPPPSAPQNKPADATPAAANSDEGARSPDGEASAPSQRHPAAAAAETVLAKPTAAKPVDAVEQAERYIYGRGVRQDCDHGLQLLKPAADQANLKAMISLGALYSTGLCTPRDLPTAYRWFALALRKQPEDQSLQDNLQKLWSQMTPPERQLAIKLSH